MTLNMLKVGESAVVENIADTCAMNRRLRDIGLIEGTRVECVQESPCGDPVAYLIRGAVIALRKEDSAKIKIYRPAKENI